MALARELGWEVYATEKSEYAARYIRESLNIECFCGDLVDAQFPDEFFDVVTGWHVLEHLPNPLDNLVEIRRILKRDGSLVIAVPNLYDIWGIARSLIRYGNRWHSLFEKETDQSHLFHFSPKTLTKLVGKAGFKIIQVENDEVEAVNYEQKVFRTISKLLYLIIRIPLDRAFIAYGKKR